MKIIYIVKFALKNSRQKVMCLLLGVNDLNYAFGLNLDAQSAVVLITVSIVSL